MHLLASDERMQLRAIERGAILRASVAGALSALVSAVAEMIAQETTDDTLRFWLIVGGATAVASVFEIGFLYWDALRAVHRLSGVARIDLFASETEEKSHVAAALARAALELPNPRSSPFGIDPMREASRARLLLASLFYKAKISATNFLAKLLIRRLLGRAIVRTWLPLVALPVTASWNGIVCWLVLREARLRAAGPSAARELARAIFEKAPVLSEDARVAALRAVASSIVRSRDLHPNLVAFLVDVRAETKIAHANDLDDPERFLTELRRLDAGEQRVVFRVLAAAAVLDGRLSRDERRLIAEAQATCGLSANVREVEALRRTFLAGGELGPAIAQIAPE